MFQYIGDREKTEVLDEVWYLTNILSDTQPNGVTEALVSFWGEPFMSQSTANNVPRYILHVQAHSELLKQLIELDRNCCIHDIGSSNI